MFEEELNYEGMNTAETGMDLCSEEETEESGVSTLVKLVIAGAGAAAVGGLAWLGKKLHDRKKAKKTEETETDEATEDEEETSEESGEAATE